MINNVTYEEIPPQAVGNLKLGRMFLISKRDVDGSVLTFTCMKSDEDKKSVYAIDVVNGKKIRLEKSTLVEPWLADIILRERVAE